MNFIQLRIIGAAAILAILGGIAFKLRHDGYLKCQTDETKQIVKEVIVHDNIENKVIKLRDPDLDKRLSHWLRD